MYMMYLEEVTFQQLKQNLHAWGFGGFFLSLNPCFIMLNALIFKVFTAINSYISVF